MRLASSLFLAVLLLAGCAPKSATPPRTPADPQPSAAEQEAAIAELCTKLPCRKLTRVRIHIDDKHIYEVDFPPFPWVVEESLVSIIPGETLHIEVDVGKDGRLERLRAVPEVTVPDRTVTLVFTATAGSTEKMLEVKNPFDRPLRFELGMQLAGRDGFYKTSSVPAVPRGSAVELWHDPIVQLIVTGFRLLDPAG